MGGQSFNEASKEKRGGQVLPGLLPRFAILLGQRTC